MSLGDVKIERRMRQVRNRRMWSHAWSVVYSWFLLLWFVLWPIDCLIEHHDRIKAELERDALKSSCVMYGSDSVKKALKRGDADLCWGTDEEGRAYLYLKGEGPCRGHNTLNLEELRPDAGKGNEI